MTVEAVSRFLADEFPQVFNDASGLTIEEVWQGGARVRRPIRQSLSGPAAPSQDRR
jgi:hypothetical protein